MPKVGLDDYLATGGLISDLLTEAKPELDPIDAGDEPRRQVSVSSRWPDPINENTYYGLTGEFIRLLEDHTESDPAALLVQFLVAVGNVVGRGPHWWAESDYHALNLNAVLVGQSSKGRKGTSWGISRKCFVKSPRIGPTIGSARGFQPAKG